MHYGPGWPGDLVMVDPALMRGESWVRCCICGELHTEPFMTLAKDADGVRWDVCEGDCAQEAGIDSE
jgi:hypothetical protein